jgi:hypothetical protein
VSVNLRFILLSVAGFYTLSRPAVCISRPCHICRHANPHKLHNIGRNWLNRPTSTHSSSERPHLPRSGTSATSIMSRPPAGLPTNCSCRRRLSRTSLGCKWDRARQSFHPSCLSVRPPESQHGRRYTSCMREEHASVLLSPVQAYPESCRLATRSGRSLGHVAVWVPLPFDCRRGAPGTPRI